MRLIVAVMALSLLGTASVAAQGGFRTVDRIPGPDGYWDYATVDASAHRLYVSREYGVMAVDLASGAKTEKLVDGAHVHATLPLPGGALVVSSNGASGKIKLFDAQSGAVKAEAEAGKSPDGMLIEPKSGLIVVFAGKSHDARLFDLNLNGVGEPMALDGKPEAAAADGEGRVFVNIEDKGEIQILDIADRKAVAAYPLPGCEAPTGLGRWPAHKTLITACSNGVALALDETTGRVLARLDIGKGPDAVIVDLARSNAFIPCGGDGQLVRLRLGDDGSVSVAELIPTQRGARTGAVDSLTGRLYLPAAKFDEGGDGRSHPVPGTFEILVLTDAP